MTTVTDDTSPDEPDRRHPSLGNLRREPPTSSPRLSHVEQVAQRIHATENATHELSELPDHPLERAAALFDRAAGELRTVTSLLDQAVIAANMVDMTTRASRQVAPNSIAEAITLGHADDYLDAIEEAGHALVEIADRLQAFPDLAAL